MADNKNFLQIALTSFKTTGSVAESSSFLINNMLKTIDFSKDLKVIELGPGNGIITKEILKRMNSNSKLYSYEINEDFIQSISQIIDKKFEVLQKSAEDISIDFEEKSIDYVISSLPLAIFSYEMKKSIIEKIRLVLKDNGNYVQYQYSVTDHGLIKEVFGKSNVKLGFTLINIPPAFVYTSRKVN